ncbi:Crp/Fnr family transcriptional regulator [Oxalobacteraceae bacterium OM1]|nr:Crp/Fnr family transcriptional regulator [Oxalobacteraceae bacterium OM1]
MELYVDGDCIFVDSTHRGGAMEAPPLAAVDCTNLVLSRLPETEYQALRPDLEFFPTPAKTVLFHRDEEITHIYFPLSGCHSVLAVMQNGAAVEVGTIGNEGLSTVDVLTGSTVATETTVCQIPSDNLRIPTAQFKRALENNPELRHLSYRFLQGYLSHISQSVACNRLHSTEERFARWILASEDRVGANEFPLTQEYLADMLGVHRPSVSVIARRFQQAGLLDYRRGVVTVLDRRGLEAAACECYAEVKKQFARVLGKPLG